MGNHHGDEHNYVSPDVRPQLVDDPQRILDEDDPIDVLARVVQEAIFNDETLMRCSTILALRSMGLDPFNTLIGGDEDDEEEQLHRWLEERGHTLSDIVNIPRLMEGAPKFLFESSPRYQEYWEIVSRIQSMVLAQIEASQRFRFRKDFTPFAPGAQS